MRPNERDTARLFFNTIQDLFVHCTSIYLCKLYMKIMTFIHLWILDMPRRRPMRPTRSLETERHNYCHPKGSSQSQQLQDLDMVCHQHQLLHMWPTLPQTWIRDSSVTKMKCCRFGFVSLSPALFLSYIED